MDPDRLFKTVLAEASAAGADEADVYLVDSRGTTVQVNKREVESVKQSRDIGYGVRVLKDHRMASFHSASFDLQEVASGVRRAVEIAGLLPQDELLGIPEPTAVSDVDLQLVDPDLKALTTDQRVAVAMEIEKRALDVDPRVITDFVIFEDATDLFPTRIPDTGSPALGDRFMYRRLFRRVARRVGWVSGAPR